VFAAVSVTALGALKGGYTLGDILLVLTLSQTLINTVGPIARQINQAGELESTAERLVELLDVASEHADRPDALPLTRLDRIVFENVSFRYPGKEGFALSHISFELPAGPDFGAGGPERQWKDHHRQAADALL